MLKAPDDSTVKIGKYPEDRYSEPMVIISMKEYQHLKENQSNGSHHYITLKKVIAKAVTLGGTCMFDEIQQVMREEHYFLNLNKPTTSLIVTEYDLGLEKM